MGTVSTAIENRALAAVEVLSRLGVVRAAYIFGSHVEGTPDRWSDIDVAVFMEGVEHWDIHRRATAMALVMEQVGSDVEAHLFPVTTLDNPPRGGFARYIRRHGARLRSLITPGILGHRGGAPIDPGKYEQGEVP